MVKSMWVFLVTLIETLMPNKSNYRPLIGFLNKDVVKEPCTEYLYLKTA